MFNLLISADGRVFRGGYLGAPGERTSWWLHSYTDAYRARRR